MVRRRHQHQRVVGKGLAHQVHLFRRLAHDDQVVLVGRQSLQQRLAVAHEHGDLDARVCCAEAAQQLGHAVLHRGQDGQFQAAALHTLQRGEVFAQPLQAHIDVGAGLGQHVACGRQEDFLAQLFEQRLTHGFRQLLDLQRQRGRREVQGLGRAREAVVLRDGVKDAQLVQGGVSEVHGGLLWF